MATDERGTIIVTVPHAACPPKKDVAAWWSTGNHACDYSGPPAGRLLEEALRKRDRRVLEYEATVPRTTMDMNRFKSRTSEWRKHLASVMSSGKIDCVLDTHSYPAGYASFGDADIVLMTEGPPAKWQLELAEDLTFDGKFRYGHVVRPDTTDLTRDAHDRGIPAVLIEFSEGLTKSDLRILTDRIAEYVCLPVGVRSPAAEKKSGIRPARVRSQLTVEPNTNIAEGSAWPRDLQENVGTPNGLGTFPAGRKTICQHCRVAGAKYACGMCHSIFCSLGCAEKSFSGSHGKYCMTLALLWNSVTAAPVEPALSEEDAKDMFDAVISAGIFPPRDPRTDPVTVKDPSSPSGFRKIFYYRVPGWAAAALVLVKQSIDDGQ